VKSGQAVGLEGRSVVVEAWSGIGGGVIVGYVQEVAGRVRVGGGSVLVRGVGCSVELGTGWGVEVEGEPVG